MEKGDSLDDDLLKNVESLVRTLNGSNADDATIACVAISRRLAESIRNADARNAKVARELGTILTRITTEVDREARIKLLAETCFYLTRVGRAYDAMPLGEHAVRLAVPIAAKNLERFSGMALGTAYLDGACFEDACRTFERVLVLAREQGEVDLECAALTNTASLLKEMGLYRDAMQAVDRALGLATDSPRGHMLSLANASCGLFAAHRLGSHDNALRYLKIGSDAAQDSPLSDVFAIAGFEFHRALYLLSINDHETAEVLVKAAKERNAGVHNERVHILLDVASSLCDWASREPARERTARKQLIELYHRTKKSRVHHDDVLRALVDVHKRTQTGELDDLDQRYAQHPEDNTAGLDALSRIVTQTARVGIDYARELIEYNSGGRPQSPNAEATGYIAGVKRAKFYRQMQDRSNRKLGGELGTPFDPFTRARALLAGDPAQEPSPADRPPRPEPQDELVAIHGDMAKLRVQSLRATMRTAAYDVAENWALTAEFFDDQTGEHCFRVGRLAGMLAAEIGIDADNCLRIEHAARLHDIGKIAVNELILLKPGPLDTTEVIAMRAHTDVGAQLLESSSDPTLQMAAVIAKYHHAWWNGAGYPAVSHEDIPLAARICAYADVYDALTNERPYKRAWPHKLAVEQMMCESGVHFDPRLMQPFLRVLERYVGSNGAVAPNRPHLEDMQMNGLLTSHRALMARVHEV
jgi:putative nucleotidyltransferase with HDIG domain